MGRETRVEEPGGFYHAGTRGNFGQTVFRDAHDYRAFLDHACRIARRYDWTIYSYCLMPNHYHFLMKISRWLSAGMQELNGGFSRRTNRRYLQRGHLFRNRFWCALIAEDSHLLGTCRYIDLNPVRGTLCDRPEDWPWSSCRACAGLELGHPLLATSEMLRLFGDRPRSAERAYRRFVRDGYATH